MEEKILIRNQLDNKIVKVDQLQEVIVPSEGWIYSLRKNIGVDKYQIGLELTKLIEDCAFWVENKRYSEDEIALRFKHRLVKIHHFPNGNGRHSPLCAHNGNVKPLLEFART